MAIKAREALMEEAELRKQLVESLEERTRKQKDRIDELEAERMTMQQQQIIAFRELQTKLHEAEDKLRAKEKVGGAAAAAAAAAVEAAGCPHPRADLCANCRPRRTLRSC
jgi:TolA-binding protein